MNNHGYGSDDRDFREFRQRKAKHQRQARDVREVDGEGRRDAVHVIEERDRREALENRLRREMFEFVRDTTKLAAGVLARVGDEQASTLSRQISDEMRDFFRTAMWGTEDLVEVLKAKHGPDVLKLSPAEIEAHMAALGVEDMDRYRAQGNEQVAMRHFGQRMEASAAKPSQAPRSGHAVIANRAHDFTSHEPAGEEEDCDDDDSQGEDEPLQRGIETSRAGEQVVVPVDFANLLADTTLAKRTLEVLVRSRLLDAEQARRIFASRPQPKPAPAREPARRQVQRPRRSKGGTR